MKRTLFGPRVTGCQDGSVLILVLIVTSILLMSSFWAISTYRQGVKSTRQLLDKINARVAVVSVLEALQYYGSTGRFTSRTLQNGISANLSSVPMVFNLSSKGVTFSLNDVMVQVSMQDSAGLINAWYVSAKVMDNLLLMTGASLEEAATIVDSLRDWRDRDDMSHLNGAESWYYLKEQRKKYGPRNNWVVQDVHELSLLRGMTPERFQAILPFLAVAPVPGRNLATMSPVVLAATLGLPSEEVDGIARILQGRGSLTSFDIASITSRAGSEFMLSNGFPSRTVRVEITTQVNDAREQLIVWFDFVPDAKAPYRILSINKGLDE